MHNESKSLIAAYTTLSVSDALTKILKLNQIYFKAKKSAVNLKYRKGLMQCSKQDLKLPINLHLFAIISLCKYSLIPVYGLLLTINIFKNEEIFKKEYLDMFNSIYNEINENEELERSDIALFLADVYEEFSYALPDSYKGHKLSDATIRISRREMIKFLKKNKIILEELPVEEEGYTDYNVICLKK